MLTVQMVCRNPDCEDCDVPRECDGWRERDRFEPMVDEMWFCPECGEEREIDQ